MEAKLNDEEKISFERVLMQKDRIENEAIVRLTPADRQAILSRLPTSVNLQLTTPCGKDNLNQCFKTPAAFRHMLLHVLPAEFLTTNDHVNLYHANTTTYNLYRLHEEYADVDFRPLQDNDGFDEKWKDRTEFDHRRKEMLTASALH